jgi:hypothetical protein
MDIRKSLSHPVCDYDGTSDEDLPDIDERGQQCRMWWEPADAA